MIHNKRFTAAIALATWLLLVGNVQAQVIQEVEPNEPCSAAQSLNGPLALPTVVAGDLSDAFPDVDFFRIEALPGEPVQIDLEGISTGAGSLGDPLLGLFDADCNQLATNDDGGTGLNSRLSVITPGDGVIVVAATSYPDFLFVGGTPGSYTLTFSRPMLIQSIAGRIVNANTGMPLPGNDTPFTFVQLLRCVNGQCFEFVNYQPADASGNFLFDVDNNGSALLAGTYQLTVNAFGYEFFIGEPFEAFEGDIVDLGDIGLTPFRVIGSLSGRLVDAFDGNPLNGGAPPYAGVVLERCEEFACYGISSANPDENGVFQFNGQAYGLSPGLYQLRSFADGYQTAISAMFDIAENEDLDIGNFELTPFPIQILGSTACDLPAGGGVCEYTVNLRARSPHIYRGEAWSSVDVYGPPNYNITRFQVGRVGSTNPMPHQVNLRDGQTQTIRFSVNVPGDLPVGTSICPFVTVGQKPAPQFNNQGTQFLFCAIKEVHGLEVMSDKDARKRLRKLQGGNNQDDMTRRCSH